MRKSIHKTVVGLLYTLLPLAALAASSCSKPGFGNSYHSMEELAQAVLDGLRLKDEEALWALIVTPEEHETLLWEHLPESQTYSFEYVRQWSERNSRKGLRNALDRFGGIEYELIDIEFTEADEEYPEFTVHFGTRLHVRQVDTGATGVLPVLDVVVERKGQWKLMNYEE
jgi:hypothetical protein